MWKKVSMVNEIKEQLDRIEGKIDELLDGLGESSLSRRHRDRASKQEFSEPRPKSKLSLEELNARLDKLI
ncbi:hypothetical protein [Paenibacillus aceti]|uniref:hypothetical protein n=1 Tax=Paenibacillus aceti TaxID=1820010 RepID=UPI0013C44E57|nr:hypothetical protein [Paenibacillus aceti]